MPEQFQERRVGGYLLLHRLGAGGSGTVWAARDGAGNQVALKLLHPTLALDEASRRRLAQEARLVNQVQGAGVTRVIDYEADAAEPFIVTEFIEGPTLSEIIANGPLSLAEAADLADDLLEILSRVHFADVVHRDLKPSNVIMSECGPQLIDFGIAQEDTDERLTKTGLISGTPGFVSPELLSSAGDASFETRMRGDWWAWSALILNAVTGRPPFGAGHSQALTYRLFQGDPDVAGLPPELQSQFRRALAVDPTSRIVPDELALSLRHAANYPEATEAATEASPAPAPTAQQSPGPARSALDQTRWAPAAASPPNTQIPPPPETLLAARSPAQPPLVPLPVPYQPPRVPVFPVAALAVLLWIAILPATLQVSGAFIALLILLIFGWVGAGSEWVEKRRVQQGGPRSNDLGVALALFPRHLIAGTLQIIPGLITGGALGVLAWMVAAGSASWGLESLALWVRGEYVAIDAPVVWLIAVLTVTVTYVFPTSKETRRGLRIIVWKTVPNPWVRGILAALLLAGALFLVFLMQEGDLYAQISRYTHH